jgi:hypothetical protein
MRAILVAAAMLMLASPAMGRVSIAPWPVPPIEPPGYPGDPPAGYVYRWVPPVYRTVTERVWIPERIERVEQWVEVSPGCWERVWRTIVIPGRYEHVTRRVLVSAGYWQLVRVDRPWPRPVPLPRPVITNPPTVGVEGYSRSGGEDLSKFSGLSEWPERK